MGRDISGFLEVETNVAGQYDSLCQLHWFPRNSGFFRALVGSLEFTPLIAPRGIPTGLGAHGFGALYRRIIDYTQAPDYRGTDYVLRWEVGHAEVLRNPEERWSCSELGYILDPNLVKPSWLLLSEIHAALRHAGFGPEALDTEYQFMLKTMELAEQCFHRKTRFVFWFDQ